MHLFILVFVLVAVKYSTTEPLRPEDVEEGRCIRPYPRAVTPNFNALLETYKNCNFPYYVPMGSKHLYRSYASYLLGRPPNSQDELDKMNLRLRGSVSNTWLTSGYGRRFFQQCVPNKHLFRTSCVAGLGSPGTDLAKICRTTDTLVYTDNESVLVIVRCVMGIWSDWKAISKKPELSQDTKIEILNFITKLGFNSSMVEYAKY